MSPRRLGGIGLAACVALGALLPPSPSSAGPDLVARGEYLVHFGSCHDCHSPKLYENGIPVPDPSRLLSGHPADLPVPAVEPAVLEAGDWVLFNDHFTAVVGPWGVSFSANLTPDPKTGIGSWTEELFIATLRNGKHLGTGRPILPPMPWPALAQATDEDLKAIFAYLRTLPPVENRVPDPLPPDAIPLAKSE
jgi:mono/diheme cytochrome c family protein